MKLLLGISGWIIAAIFAFFLFKGCGEKIIVPADNTDSVKAVIKTLHDSTTGVLKVKDSIIGTQQVKIITLSNQVKNIRTHERIGYDSLNRLKKQIEDSKNDSAALFNYCKIYIDLTDQLANDVSIEHDKNDSIMSLYAADTVLYRDQLNTLKSENKRLQELLDVMLKEKSDLRDQLIAALKGKKRGWLWFILGVFAGASTNFLHK